MANTTILNDRDQVKLDNKKRQVIQHNILLIKREFPNCIEFYEMSILLGQLSSTNLSHRGIHFKLDLFNKNSFTLTGQHKRLTIEQLKQVIDIMNNN